MASHPSHPPLRRARPYEDGGWYVSHDSYGGRLWFHPEASVIVGTHATEFVSVT